MRPAVVRPASVTAESRRQPDHRGRFIADVSNPSRAAMSLAAASSADVGLLRQHDPRVDEIDRAVAVAVLKDDARLEEVGQARRRPAVVGRAAAATPELGRTAVDRPTMAEAPGDARIFMHACHVRPDSCAQNWTHRELRLPRRRVDVREQRRARAEQRPSGGVVAGADVAVRRR